MKVAKIKKLNKKLNELLRKEFDPDGFVRFDTLSVDIDDADGNHVLLKGAYGIERADGRIAQNDFELSFTDGKSFSFISGMFYQFFVNDKPLKEYNIADGHTQTEKQVADGESI